MPGSDDIAEQQKILEMHRRALALLLEQHAQFGALYVPPYIVFGIEQCFKLRLVDGPPRSVMGVLG